MTISSNDAAILRANGFIEEEITKLANATAPNGNLQPPVDLNDPVWQAAIKERSQWKNSMVNRGWTIEQINREILFFYTQDERNSPFDFIRAAYKDHSIGRPTDVEGYRSAMQARTIQIAVNKTKELYKK